MITKEILKIEVAKIAIDEEMDIRENRDNMLMRDLENSISKIGLINPITVTQTDNGYEVVAGRRRLLAHKNLGKSHIMAMVIKGTKNEMLALQLHENWGREDVSPIEEGKFFLSLVSKEYTIPMIADMGGMTTQYVKGRMGLACMPKVIRELLKEKRVSIEGARLLARIENEKVLNDMCEIIDEGGMGTQTIRNWVKEHERNTGKTAEEIIRIEYETGDTGEQKRVFRCSVCNQRYNFHEVTTNWICMGCTQQLQQINAKEQAVRRN